ncbi:MAG TPA: hypothetical protein VGE27_07615 [Gemmatimonas sp.]|uniref:hypothetical protein n=1 Tax=Gemmatimonas sp. TaxID=1962908 RepID=UPI002EDAEF80
MSLERIRSACALALALAMPMFAGCMATTDVGNNNGVDYFARISGTVTRADGSPNARAQIGVSCVGSEEVPFGITGEADANGRFALDLNVPRGFRPLEGPLYACRVLTPYLGTPQAEKTVPIQVGTSTRPVTEITLVIP